MDLLVGIVIGVLLLGAIAALLLWASRARRNEPRMVNDTDYLEPELKTDRGIQPEHPLPETAAGAEWTRHGMDRGPRNRALPPEEQERA